MLNLSLTLLGLLEVCRLPLDYGGCSSFLPRWYYNTDKRRCEQFSYGGCFGNSNRFLTKLECDNACTHNDVCGLPKPVNSIIITNRFIIVFVHGIY